MDSLKGKVYPKFFEDVHARLECQAGHAIVWRDAIVQYFLKQSGIPDEKGRAGHFPGHMEAEYARLTGYKVIAIDPWEDASRGKAVSCDLSSAQGSCRAEFTYRGPSGRFDVAVQYFDLQCGVAKFIFEVSGRSVAQWPANASLPWRDPTGDNSTRFTVREVELKTGDVLRVEGTLDGIDPAALDYIEIEPPGTAIP